MKKIIITIFLFSILVSCGNEEKKELNNKIEEKKDIVSENISDNKNTNSNGELSFLDVEKNLAKLKNIKLNSIELEVINSEILNKYVEKIELDALNSKNIKICDKLDRSNIDSCKKRFFVTNYDIKSCDSLRTEDFQRVCRNSIIKEEASKKLDEELCKKLTFQEQQSPNGEKDLILDYGKRQIQDCKNRVLIKKAINSNEQNICDIIIGKNEKSNCIELVKMEIRNKELEVLLNIESNTGIKD